jgi:hypothetical protein
MPAFDQRHTEAASDSAADVALSTAGKRTLASDLEVSSTEDAEPAESLGPPGDEAEFDFAALSSEFGSATSDGAMASAVLGHEADADDQVNPEALFESATSGPPSALPHRAKMEAAFGRPLDDVTAYLGASGPLHAMDANAAARGNVVAFDSASPSVDDVSHELTHVEQNRNHGGGGRAIHASGRVSDPNSESEHEAEVVSKLVATDQPAPAIQAAPDAGVQRSFISFAVKMGAKKASKGMLKNFIKTRIKDKLKNMLNKKMVKELAEEADQIMSILEDPWWVTAIGFVPVVGDVFDLVNVPTQIRKAINRADSLENKVKKAIELEQQAQKTAVRASKAVKWTAHGGKHVANIKMAWKDVIASTKNGPAKYRHGTNIESLERGVWAEGQKVTNGKTWKVKEFGEEIGASEGKSSRWMRVEESAGTIHGHPISEIEFRKLTK